MSQSGLDDVSTHPTTPPFYRIDRDPRKVLDTFFFFSAARVPALKSDLPSEPNISIPMAILSPLSPFAWTSLRHRLSEHRL